MKLLPYDHFTVSAPDPPSVILNRLKDYVAYIEPASGVRFSQLGTPYEGVIFETGFKIKRRVKKRSTQRLLLPVIDGKLHPLERGTQVQITIRMESVNLTVLIMTCISWFIFLPMSFPSFHILEIIALYVFLPSVFLVIFWLVFGYAVTQSRREITKILQGEPV